MTIISPDKCRCNSENPGFSGNFTRSWPGRQFLRAQPGNAPAPRSIPEGCNQLLAEIRKRLPRGQATVQIRQVDLAAMLHVDPVTIRRRTRILQQAGALLARRGKNVIAYTVTAVTRKTDSAPTQQELITVSPPPALAPKVHVAAATSEPKPKQNRSPRCPEHKKTRLSWMSQPLQRDVYHCPAATGPNSHCSWLYSPEFGQLNPPSQAEITIGQVQARLATLSDSRTTAPAIPEAAVPDTDTVPVADTEAQQLWHRITAVLERRAQPEDVKKFLAPAQGTAYDGQTLDVAAAQPFHLRWLRESFTMSFAHDALAQVLGRQIQIRYHVAGASA